MFLVLEPYEGVRLTSVRSQITNSMVEIKAADAKIFCLQKNVPVFQIFLSVLIELILPSL